MIYRVIEQFTILAIRLKAETENTGWSMMVALKISNQSEFRIQKINGKSLIRTDPFKPLTRASH